MFGQHPKLQAVDPIGAAHGCGPTGGTDCWEVWKSQEITFFLNLASHACMSAQVPDLSALKWKKIRKFQPEIFQLQWEDFESFLDDTELRGDWFRRTAMLWQYDYSEIRWNKKHHWAWLFTAEYGSQVASLPSPCGRCHRALFHDSWLFFMWVDSRYDRGNVTRTAMVSLGSKVMKWQQNVNVIIALKFFKSSTSEVWEIFREDYQGSLQQLSKLFGDDDDDWCGDCSEVHLFFVLICKRLFQTLKISENREAKIFCSGCDVSPRGGKENPAGLASCRHDKRH